jgi:hypothetical protein
VGAAGRACHVRMIGVDAEITYSPRRALHESGRARGRGIE